MFFNNIFILLQLQICCMFMFQCRHNFGNQLAERNFKSSNEHNRVQDLEAMVLKFNMTFDLAHACTWKNCLETLHCCSAYNLSFDHTRSFIWFQQIISLCAGALFSSQGAGRGDTLPSRTNCSCLCECMESTRCYYYLFIIYFWGN